MSNYSVALNRECVKNFLYHLVRLPLSCILPTELVQYYLNSDPANYLSKTMSAPVFEHFEMPTGSTGTVKVKCKHCAASISGSVKTTSNFVTHLKVSVSLSISCIF